MLSTRVKKEERKCSRSLDMGADKHGVLETRDISGRFSSARGVSRVYVCVCVCGCGALCWTEELSKVR